MMNSKLQGDSDTYYGVVFVINKNLRVSAERGSAFSDRMRSKRFNAVLALAAFASAWPAVFNL